MFVSGPNQYRDATFIELVYDSVIVGVLISLFSSRLASILSCAATLAGIMMVYRTNAFGHGSVAGRSFLEAIALRPALATLLLLMLPAIGPLGRLFLRRKANADG